MLILPGQPDVLDPARRRCLAAAAGALSALLLPPRAGAAGFLDRPRELWLRRAGSGEEVRAVYWANGRLQADGYRRICTLLRDVKANQAVQFDLLILDIVRSTQGWLEAFGVRRPLIIQSGYRTRSTNSSEGGARNSMHLQAKAIDLRVEGVSTESIARFGIYLRGGGVGFYPSRGFIHLDTGGQRFWRG